MKYWTVQSKEVLHIINNKNIYMPDFEKSSYLKKLNYIPKPLYDKALTIFNTLNNCNVSGIVFCFVATDNQFIKPFKDLRDLKNSLIEQKEHIDTLWENFDKESVIIELEVTEKFLNPAYIDFNDFQFLMPPIMYGWPLKYEEEDINRILMHWERGMLIPSIFPSGFLQAHLPYISKNDIINVYDMFSYSDLSDKDLEE